MGRNVRNNKEKEHEIQGFTVVGEIFEGSVEKIRATGI